MFKSLSECRLFRGIELSVLDQLLSDVGYNTKSYSTGDVIAIQGAKYNQLLILVEGSIVAETTDSSQNRVQVEHITAPALIAPAFLFAENNLMPVTISAYTPVYTIALSKESFMTMLRADCVLLTNYLEIVSNPNAFLSEKVVYLTYKTIKGKFSNYLLNKMESEQSTSFRNTLTQREMAEMFGVTRPALARAIGELVEDGSIYVQGKQINILFAEKLRQYAKN